MSRRVNGASTIEGLPWIIPTLEGTGVGTDRVVGNVAPAPRGQGLIHGTDVL